MSVKRVLVLATAVAALLVPAAPASAGLLDGCGDRALERPFLRFLDPLAYTLVPGGTSLAELRRCSGSQFDPGVVEALAAVVG